MGYSHFTNHELIKEAEVGEISVKLLEEIKNRFVGLNEGTVEAVDAVIAIDAALTLLDNKCDDLYHKVNVVEDHYDKDISKYAEFIDRKVSDFLIKMEEYITKKVESEIKKTLHAMFDVEIRRKIVVKR